MPPSVNQLGDLQHRPRAQDRRSVLGHQHHHVPGHPRPITDLIGIRNKFHLRQNPRKYWADFIFHDPTDVNGTVAKIWQYLAKSWRSEVEFKVHPAACCVLGSFINTRVPAAGVGPPPWPRHFPQSSPGEQEFVVARKQVAGKSKVEGCVSVMDGGFWVATGRSAIFGQQDDMLVVRLCRCWHAMDCTSRRVRRLDGTGSTERARHDRGQTRPGPDPTEAIPPASQDSCLGYIWF